MKMMLFQDMRRAEYVAVVWFTFSEAKTPPILPVLNLNTLHARMSSCAIKQFLK